MATVTKEAPSQTSSKDRDFNAEISRRKFLRYAIFGTAATVGATTFFTGIVGAVKWLRGRT